MDRPHHRYGLLKYLLMQVGIIRIVSGIVLLGVGAWVWIWCVAATFVQVMGSFSAQLVTLSYVCLGAGGMLVVLGSIGYIGAWKEKRCLIILYFLITSLIFVVEILGTIFILVFKDLVAYIIHVACRTSLLTTHNGPSSTDLTSNTWTAVTVSGLNVVLVVAKIKDQMVLIGSRAMEICAMELASMIVSLLLIKGLGNGFDLEK